jgi:hypothetical protein
MRENDAMQIPVDFTPQELAALRALTNSEDASEAVRIAAIEYIRHCKRQELRALAGKVEMAENWQDCEAAELNDSHDHEI